MKRHQKDTENTLEKNPDIEDEGAKSSYCLKCQNKILISTYFVLKF